MEKGVLRELRSHMYISPEPPIVSVVMIAYNVDRFLTEAIESVLNQRTNFKVELIIGEDASTDKTRSIAIGYQNKFPHIIKTLLHEKNLGLTPNCIATHHACKGKYIALLDGDDYWTDINKLQKQVEFLEQCNDYSGCAHQAMKIYEDGSSQPIPFGSEQEATYTLNDTITHRKFHTSSLVYRKWIWDKTGGIPGNISSNERAIYPMVALYGNIKYFKEPMCVYRLSGIGLSSRIGHKELETDLKMLPWLKSLGEKFPVNKFRSFIHLCIYTYPVKKIPFLSLVKHYFSFVFLSFSYFPKNLGDLKWGTLFFFKRLFNNSSIY